MTSQPTTPSPQSEELFRLIAENIEDYAIFAIDLEGRCASWNKGVEKLLGYAEDDFIGRDACDIFTPEDQEHDACGQELRTAREQGRAEDQRWHLRKDGSRFFANGLMMSLRDDAGSLRGFTKIMRDDTKRKLMEDALRESEEFHRFAAEAGRTGSWYVRLDTEECLISPVMAELMGLPAGQRSVSAERWRERIVPEDRAGLEAALAATIERDVPFDCEFRIKLADDTERWLYSHGGAVRDDSGKALRVHGASVDITERKRADEELRESQSRFAAALAVADLGTFEWDVLTDAVTLDDRSREMFGFAEGEGTHAQHVFARINAADFDRVQSEVRVVLRDAARAEIDYRINLPDGTSRIVASINDVILGADGKVERVFGVFNDITERKAAEAERERLLRSLEVERTRLTSIFTKVSAFVATMRGPEHVFDLVNPAYMRLVGHRDLIGKTVRQAFPDIEGQGYYEIIERVYQTGEPFEGRELPVTLQLRPDVPPEERFIDLLHHPLFDEDGRVSGVFTHGIDITDQVRARKAAEEANRIKDEFLTTLSHELRTPLTSILGWTSMLASGQLQGDAAAKALGTINRNARAQTQLIDDLLDIGRIITGKLRLEVRPVELSSVIEAAADAVRPAAEAKNIRLQVLLDSAAGVVSGDADRLQQVVWNLLTNAVKFTPKGGRVQVRLERVNSHVEINVTDTGRGIAAEFLPHVFDRFRQADQTSTRAHGGLGLGLSIVRQLVELHGGTVSVDSAGKDQGATFTVALPQLVTRHEARTPERTHPTAHHTFGGTIPFDCPPALDGLRVLVIDDEEDTRELLRAVLERCGSQVTTAASAAEAIATLEAEMPESTLR